LENTDCVFHLAAQAGVRASWGSSFSVYTTNNIGATQKLLEAARLSPVKKFIFASSSSVYGSSPDLPWSEDSLPAPFSPYGVSKLAAEHLCRLYYKNFGIPTLSLRFFTVYGPGQRPDMAFHRFFKAALEDKSLSLFGDGRQTRDFTYVDDIVEANLASIEKGRPGEVYNIGGGHRKSLQEILPLLESACRKSLSIRRQEEQKGDAPHTCADISKAEKDLDYRPQTSLEEGLRKEWIWLKKLYSP
jgi:UDP-glucose 4-epimerase